MTRPDLESEYRHARELLRVGADVLADQDAKHESEPHRRTVAHGILAAYELLTEEDSPFRDQLTEAELRTVTLARAVLADNVGTKPM